MVDVFKWNKNRQDRKQGIRILATTTGVALVLAGFISYTIRSVEHTVTQSCFDNLATASEGLGNELRKASNEDLAVLSAIANVIANEDFLDNKKLTMLLNSYDLSASYLSYVELLRPDNTMLDSDGTIRDVSDKMNFKEEAENGKYISSVDNSTKEPGSKVIRTAVPVVKDGETLYIIYGTVRLEDFAKKFDVNIYNGEAYIFVEDGDTGEMILDTWHPTLGNITDFKNRKLLPGNTWEQAIADLERGESGRLSIISTRINEVIYLYYAPSGINNWNVMVMTSQRVALAESQTIRTQLYFMAFVIAIIMLGYMIFITRSLLQSYQQIKKIGLEDKGTGLMNRNAYDQYVLENQEHRFPMISCIYVDANGLHEINNQYGHAAGDSMLRTIAEALKGEFPDDCVYRIGGDEFVVFSEKHSREDVDAGMKRVAEQIMAHDYSISYGIVTYENEIGVERIARKADEKMLEDKSLYYSSHDRRKMTSAEATDGCRKQDADR